MANQLTTTTSRPRKTGWFIGVTCPGCGAELEMQDDFFVLTCSHCESVLRIVMPDMPPAFLVKTKVTKREAQFQLDRYCREHGLPFTSGATVSPVSLPHWKIDAVALKVRHTTYEVERSEDESYDEPVTEERVFKAINLIPLTLTRLAVHSLDCVPVSLGLRTEYVRMIPYSQENADPDTTYHAVAVPLTDAQRAAFKGVVDAGNISYDKAGKNLTELFLQSASVVYFPYYRVDSITSRGIRTFYLDAVTGKVAGVDEHDIDAPIPESSSESHIQFGSLHVVLHRCGNCGVDLPATRSLVYQCHNCERIAFFDRHELLQKQVMTVSSANNDTTCLPFWSMQLAPEDQSALRRMFGGIAGSDRIMVPAFRVRNVEAMYRLCKRMSAASGKLTFAPLATISNNSSPVAVSLHEAITTVALLWRRDLAGREMRTNIDSGFNPISAQLAYVPFRTEQYFLVDTVLGAVTVETGALTE